MRSRLLVLASIPLFALTSCDGNKFTKDDFFKEYEKRIANFKALGSCYTSASVGPDDYIKTPVGKYKIDSAFLHYEKYNDMNVCVVDFFNGEEEVSVKAVSGYTKGLIEEGYNYWNKLCSTINLKLEGGNLIFAGYAEKDLIVKMVFDKNDYLIEQYMYTFDFGFSIHITYNK